MGGVGLEGRWMGMNLKRDEEGGRERERCLNVVIAGATEEVAYVSGPLDARGGVYGCVCVGCHRPFFRTTGQFHAFLTYYEIRNLIKDLVILGLFYTFLFLLLH